GEAAGDDQRRVSTPAAARAAGADLLVIGRPLTRAADPERALQQLAQALA
ncbi:MAG: orotidine 5'-phosphate decarboxylase / HUMPS family protein, partial [Thermoanaerobaculia bacterium]